MRKIIGWFIVMVLLSALIIGFVMLDGFLLGVGFIVLIWGLLYLAIYLITGQT